MDAVGDLRWHFDSQDHVDWAAVEAIGHVGMVGAVFA
jgi:hypothetical protein